MHHLKRITPIATLSCFIAFLCTAVLTVQTSALADGGSNPPYPDSSGTRSMILPPGGEIPLMIEYEQDADTTSDSTK